MGRSRKKSLNITLVLSIVFSVICIIAVLSVRVGDQKKSLQPTYIKLEVKDEIYDDIKPKASEKDLIKEDFKEDKTTKDNNLQKVTEDRSENYQEISVEDKKTTAIDSKLENKIRSFFEELNCSIEEGWIINIPSVYSLNWIKRRLDNTLSEIGYSIKDTTIYLNGKEVLKLEFKKMPSKGKVAIIIDDVGRATRLNGILQEIKLPLNISILPKQREGSNMSLIGKKEGWDVLLHLPMEPKEKSWVDSTFITTNMGKEEIKEKVDNYLKSLPYVQGINNHMGSLATADENIMTSVLSIIKERGLYFVDSLTISNSVGEKVARDINLNRFAKRDVFIDNLDEREYIRAQIDHLVEISIRKGFAIGIGHLRENTLLTIRDYEWNNKGIELILLSDIL